MEKYFYRSLIEFDFSLRAALCSQLEHKGSVPRKDYPNMLVFENGKSIGTVGGGNLEHSVIEMAKSVIANNLPVFETFDLTQTDPSAKGSICGGRTRILIEPYTKKLRDIWKSLDLLNLHKPGVIMVTEVIAGEIVSSQRYVLHPNSSLQAIPDKIAQIIKPVWRSGKSKTLSTPDGFYLIHRISPLPMLHIFGAGHVGHSVAELAHFIDLDTTIYDDREDLANLERFPHARRICVDSFSNMAERAPISQNDYVLVMTRGHQHDLELLRWLLSLKITYLGLLSSKTKWRLLSETLLEEGYTADVLKSIHAPVGLEIKSETVPEIAISIISEIIHSIRTGNRSGPSR